MVKPVFVLGLARNGTTWLSNILCSHPEVVGAQHEAHWGIHESRICEHLLYWDNLEDNDQFIHFLETYSSGDYFKLVKGDKGYFYRNRPRNFPEFFFELMDNYARKEDAKYWITKLDQRFYEHPRELKRFLLKANARYKQIKFIGIKRKFVEVLRSSLNTQGKSRERLRSSRKERLIRSLLNTVSYANGYNHIENIISVRDSLLLQFNSLKNERSETIKKIVDHLKIDYSDQMLKDSFPANSSYSGIERTITLSWWERSFFTGFLLPFFQRFNVFASFLLKIKNKLQGELNCPLYYRLIKLERCKDSFRKELKCEGRLGLKQVLFGDQTDENHSNK